MHFLRSYLKISQNFFPHPTSTHIFSTLPCQKIQQKQQQQQHHHWQAIVSVVITLPYPSSTNNNNTTLTIMGSDWWLEPNHDGLAADAFDVLAVVVPSRHPHHCFGVWNVDIWNILKLLKLYLSFCLNGLSSYLFWVALNWLDGDAASQATADAADSSIDVHVCPMTTTKKHLVYFVVVVVVGAHVHCFYPVTLLLSCSLLRTSIGALWC